LTVIVGRNNAGKSSIVDALRLISLVTRRYQNLNFAKAPNWLDIPRRHRGVTPSLRGVELNLETVFHRYSEPPASITAPFESGDTVSVYLGPKHEIYATILDKSGEPVTTKAEALRARVPTVNILPQIAPLSLEEKELLEEYIRAASGSSLSHLHLRNELLVFSDAFAAFKKLAEATWPGLRVHALDRQGTYPDGKLTLLIRDADFTAEVAWMGHGLQMWLQTMWFLARADPAGTVILDEPDVYMHADLQRRLIRLVKGRYQQTVIATHSVEIMAEVEPENILVVERGRARSRFTSSLPAVQRLIEHIGGAHNIHLARLASAKKCVLVEGKDLEILRCLQDILFPKSEEPLDAVPNVSIGGWGGWGYAIGSAMFVKSTGEERIKMYCILDRDYHTTPEISERMKTAASRGILLHIWERKELENYLLVPAAMRRAIVAEMEDPSEAPTEGEVREKLDDITRTLRTGTMDAIATEILARDKSSGLGPANRLARERIAKAWKSLPERIGIVSGKTVLKTLAPWSQKEFKASLSARKVARHLTKDDIPAEMVAVVTAIEKSEDF
jgi:energy-coupling factor transporter ATP-binding protein EcfA2